MTLYTFATDAKSLDFCEEIAKAMTLLGVDLTEARARINRQWHFVDFIGDEDLRYHESADFWANDILYGADSRWWHDPPGLKPRPFP